MDANSWRIGGNQTREPLNSIEPDEEEDRFYQLTPRGRRFVKLQRKFEDGSIMPHEARERLIHIKESELILGPQEQRGYSLAEQLKNIFGKD